MSSNPLATVKGITVIQDDDGRVHWQGGAAVDADGSNGQNGNPFAYRKDDKGLDALANAGYPNRSWRDVLAADPQTGKPKDDGNGNWYSKTTYEWKGRPVETRYVDSTAVPYVVVNPHVRMKAKGIVIGCKARLTYKQQTIDAVVADVSGGGQARSQIDQGGHRLATRRQHRHQLVRDNLLRKGILCVDERTRAAHGNRAVLSDPNTDIGRAARVAREAPAPPDPQDVLRGIEGPCSTQRLMTHHCSVGPRGSCLGTWAPVAPAQLIVLPERLQKFNAVLKPTVGGVDT